MNIKKYIRSLLKYRGKLRNKNYLHNIGDLFMYTVILNYVRFIQRN